MGQLITFIQENWGWLGVLVSSALGGASWLINRRVSRGADRLKEVDQALDTVAEGLTALRKELVDLRTRFGIRGQAIKEATPDQGAAVFARELELLMERDRKEKD